MKYIYLFKFWLFGLVAYYDYIHNNKFCLLWLLLSMMMLSFYTIRELKQIK